MNRERRRWMTAKGMLMAASGGLAAMMTAIFGGWDAAMAALILFMAVDYLTGMIVAGVFHESPKSESGRLESRAGWKGLCRKGVTLLIVLVAARLDLIMETGFVRDGVIVAYLVNEGLSILENAALMGVPIPEPIAKAIEALQHKDRGDPAE